MWNSENIYCKVCVFWEKKWKEPITIDGCKTFNPLFIFIIIAHTNSCHLPKLWNAVEYYRCNITHSLSYLQIQVAAWPHFGSCRSMNEFVSIIIHIAHKVTYHWQSWITFRIYLSDLNSIGIGFVRHKTFEIHVQHTIFCYHIVSIFAKNNLAAPSSDCMSQHAMMNTLQYLLSYT
jgi:hypothetical protein